MNNLTNIIKYTLLAPVYDVLMGDRIFGKARKKAFSLLNFEAGQKILLVGIGTGQDLPLLPSIIDVTGIDISDAMLARAGKKIVGSNIELLKMNAEKLNFYDGSFDAVVLNLVLSVVENPHLAMAEAVRVLKRKGCILVFDKFLEANNGPTVARKLLNRVTTLIGTDINRSFKDIKGEMPLKIVQDQPALFAGNYRIILLEKD